MFVTRNIREPDFISVKKKKIFFFGKAVLVQTLGKFVFCLLKLASEKQKKIVEGFILHFAYSVSERDKKENLFFFLRKKINTGRIC